MAPPIRYTTGAIVVALRRARSLKAAAQLLGMSMGAMNKRIKREPMLQGAARECRKRGLAYAGRKRPA